MSYQTGVPSNLSKATLQARPQLTPLINSLVGRQQGILRSKYFGSYDQEGYVNDAKVYHPKIFEDPSQMQDKYTIPVKQEKTLKNLSTHLDIKRVNEPNDLCALYSKVYSDPAIIKATTTGTFDSAKNWNTPALKFMKQTS